MIDTPTAFLCAMVLFIAGVYLGALAERWSHDNQKKKED